jgi:hypothetical protein
MSMFFSYFIENIKSTNDIPGCGLNSLASKAEPGLHGWFFFIFLLPIEFMAHWLLPIIAPIGHIRRYPLQTIRSI